MLEAGQVLRLVTIDESLDRPRRDLLQNSRRVKRPSMAYKEEERDSEDSKTSNSSILEQLRLPRNPHHHQHYHSYDETARVGPMDGADHDHNTKDIHGNHENLPKDVIVVVGLTKAWRSQVVQLARPPKHGLTGT